MQSYFSEHSPLLALVLQSKQGLGLRRAQIGAIWALAARVISKERVSQAILPTGVGKSGVISALPFAVGARRVLIIVPSRIIRRQIATELNTLKLLKSVGALPASTVPPKVKPLDRSLRSSKDWNDLKDYDVVVTTPPCVSSKYKGVVPPPKDLFDLLIIDEAHHTPAETWDRILQDLSNVPAALLTATPFRSDRKRLPGEICFWYPLKEAINDRVYLPIHFTAVEPPSDASEKDDALAIAVAKCLAKTEHKEARSQVLVRTDSVSDAYRLSAIYTKHGLRLPVLTSRLSDQDTDRIIRELKEGRVSGVVVVGVLTEGFDLPHLKIAAYHRKHKSFASTLQFVGRFARVPAGKAVRPELFAFAHDLTSETDELYREDASWSDMLPAIADAAVEEERRVRHYLAAFRDKPKDFSLAAVEPRQRAQIFELQTQPSNIGNRIEKLNYSPIVDFFTDEETLLAAFVSQEIVHPDWLRSTVYDTITFDLHIAYVSRNRRYLFLRTSSDATTQQILRHYGVPDAVPVSPQKINRVLHAYQITDYSTIGLRNNRPSAGAGVAYTTLAGHSAGRGITAVDETATSAGHVSARYRDGNVWGTVGSSIDNAKVWESGRGTLSDFRDWCEDLATKLDNPINHGAPPLINVPIRNELLEYPKDALAVAMTFSFDDGDLLSRGRAVPAGDVVVRARSAKHHVILGIDHAGAILATYSMDLRGRVKRRNGLVEYVVGSEQLDLADVLSANPPVTFFADGTNAYRHTSFASQNIPTQVPSQILQTWTWTGTDPRRESKPPRAPFVRNIQEHAINHFKQLYPNCYIVVDDAANEVADVIVIRPDQGRRYFIDFLHCKWSSDDNPGHRLNDIYQVISQVARSVRWAFAKVIYKELSRRLGSRTATRLVYGRRSDLDQALAECVARPPETFFTAYGIQPGLELKDINSWAQGAALISSCHAWCTSVEVPFILCGA